MSSCSTSRIGCDTAPSEPAKPRNMQKYIVNCDGIKSAIRTYNYLKPTISSQRKEASGAPPTTPPPGSVCATPSAPPLQQQSSGRTTEPFGDESTISPETPLSSGMKCPPSPCSARRPPRSNISGVGVVGLSLTSPGRRSAPLTPEKAPELEPAE